MRRNPLQYLRPEADTQKRWLFLAAAICLVILGLLIARHSRQPPCCDSFFYGLAAQEMGEKGFFSQWEHWQRRTYGYPWLVRGLTSKHQLGSELSGLLDLRFLAVQAGIFFAACLVALVVTSDRPKLQSAIAFGVMANPLILVYVPVRLTEAPSITIAILLFSAAYALCDARLKPYARLSLLTVGSLLAGFSMMVRPSNIALTLAWVAFASLNIGGSGNKARWRDAAFCVMALLIPLLPQIALNLRYAGKLTMFPVEGLGAKQIEWGLGVLKYATLVRSPHDATGMMYANPFFSTDDISKYGASLYWRNPVEGALTLGAHLFNSFNNDLVYPYAYDSKPPLGRLFVAASQVILFAGISVGSRLLYLEARLLRTRGSLRTDDRETAPLLVALALLFGVTCAQNGVVAVETRFGLFPVAILSVLAILGFRAWWGLPNDSRARWLIACAAFVVLGCYLSDWMLTLARS